MQKLKKNEARPKFSGSYKKSLYPKQTGKATEELLF